MKKPFAILHLDARYLDAWHRDGAHFQRHARFATDETGQALFSEYLREFSRGVFYLLVDMADEDFLQADLPPVRGSDRRSLLERKLEQLFPDTPFSFASSLGKSTEGRGDEKFLFSALTRPHAIDPWLASMNAENIALAGAYTTSQLTGRFGGMRQAGCRILVTLGKSGLRQSCHLNGRFIFSRLVPADAASLAENAATIANEAEKIRQYLVGQRLIQRDERIHIACFAVADDFSQLAARLAPDDGFSYEHLVLPSLGVGDLQASDATFVQMLASRPPVGQYLPAALRQTHRLRQAKAALLKVSFVGLLGSAILVAWMLVAANDNQARHARAQEIGQEAKRRYQAMLATLPEPNQKPESLRAIAIAGESIMQRAPSVDETLVDISAILDAMPQISLRSLSWKLSANAEGTDAHDKAPAYVIAELGVQGLDADMSALFIERLAALPATRAKASLRPDELLDGNPATLSHFRLVRSVSP